jgi:hypothetical protein
VLNFDAYSAGFGVEEPGIIKALVHLTRRFKALTGAIWFGETGRWKILYKVGISDRNAEKMDFPAASSVGQALGSGRTAVVINWPLDKVEEFSDVFSSEASMKGNRLVFIPIMLHARVAFLGIALHENLDDPKGLISRALSA